MDSNLLAMPPVIALNQAFWQEDFFPPRKIALCGCLGCYPIFKGLFMFLVKASQKKINEQTKKVFTLVHNKPPHSFFYLSRTTWVSDTITQDISSNMAAIFHVLVFLTLRA